MFRFNFLFGGFFLVVCVLNLNLQCICDFISHVHGARVDRIFLLDDSASMANQDRTPSLNWIATSPHSVGFPRIEVGMNNRLGSVYEAGMLE